MEINPVSFLVPTEAEVRALKYLILVVILYGLIDRNPAPMKPEERPLKFIDRRDYRLIKLRARAGLSQPEAASYLRVAFQCYLEYENGSREPVPDRWYAQLAEARHQGNEEVICNTKP
jgi:DNA-binding XRE family transcriptional regulator